jgi:2-keto-4-pentenoate hydratase/2-oxohepta-3-ene-1,7-dioic acid hydratase in catechol pathway
MRLVSFEHAGSPGAGVLIDEQVVTLDALQAPARTVRGLLSALDSEQLDELAAQARASAARIPVAELTLGPPVGDPAKIVCLGLNYRDHARESGQEIPGDPIWFAKFENSLVGHGADIVLPRACPDAVDYEVELAVVIGRTATRVDRGDALQYVAGAMVLNDVSARDLQFLTSQWGAGKAIDTFAPCGPALVTLDELGDIQSLRLSTRVNGRTVQDGTTADQIFPVADAIAWLSRTMTLQPGDIIATGTPAGVGASSGTFLRDGDLVEVELEGVGTVANRVRRAR